MIKDKTVFILGAGSNFDYGFPLASGLRELICSVPWVNRYYVNDPILHRISGCRHDFYTEFHKVFCEVGSYSIDEFLSLRPEFAAVGKMAIILHILKAEQACNLAHPPCHKNTWYRLLLKKIIEDVQRGEIEKIKQNEISFITFNYDRSLEYFLYHNIKHLFDPENTLSYQELVPFKIIHVYGSIAPLPEEDPQAGIGFGELSCDLKKLKQGIDRLSIISDERETDKEIHELISQAQRIYFLGFSYDKANMDNLGFPGIVKYPQEIFGTVYGMVGGEMVKAYEAMTENIKNETEKPGVLLGAHAVLTYDCDKKLNLKAAAKENSKINCLTLLREWL